MIKWRVFARFYWEKKEKTYMILNYGELNFVWSGSMAFVMYWIKMVCKLGSHQYIYKPVIFISR